MANWLSGSSKRGAGGEMSAPEAALERLLEGNERFVSGKAPRGDISPARRRELADGQRPFAAILACADSRVAPEFLFGAGLGDLFVVRNAGAIAGVTAIGSLEYAVVELGAPLILVIGHERCGAVAAAAQAVTQNTAFPGSIGPMLEPIVEAVRSVEHAPGDLVHNAVQANVRHVVARLRTASPILSEAQGSGRLAIVGATKDLADGVVQVVDAPPGFEHFLEG